jgi:uncharacterized protein (DUF488 family)
MRLYTLGFAGKDAREFFGLLRQHGVRRVVDIRLRPNGQLSGFARGRDLHYFLTELADGCAYEHQPELAPTTEILTAYRKDGDWAAYVARFEALMDERRISEALDRASFERQVTCLLCSEASADACHRRLVAERLARAWPGVEVVHL